MEVLLASKNGDLLRKRRDEELKMDESADRSKINTLIDTYASWLTPTN